MNTPLRAILSPCVGVCTLRPDGVCEGCLRSVDEIAAWSRMSDAERLYVMDVLLPLRDGGTERA